MSAADRDHLKLFAGRAGMSLAQAMCTAMDIPLGKARTDLFPDSELFVKVEEDVRGRDCFVVQSTCDPVNANLMELLIYIDCLRRASARRITAVIPYFGYARQDRKDEGRVPITAKLVANLITTAGADRVVAVDLHAAQIQGFFDIPTDHLYARHTFMEHVKSLELENPIIVSPDVGGVKMARGYAKGLHADIAIVDKRRISGAEVIVENVVGEVEGQHCWLVDDLTTTAGTLSAAAALLKKRGAKTVSAAVSHALLTPEGVERFKASPIDALVTTASVPSPALNVAHPL